MTKKLEETFNLSPIVNDEDATVEEIVENPTMEQSSALTELLNSEIQTIDKIDSALPTVQDLNQHDREMDDIHTKALNAFEELFQLGMNVEVHAGAKLMETANSMLKTAMEAKDSKVDRKLKMINLQMQKAKLEHQIEKETKKVSGDSEIEGDGAIVIDRNELLRRIAKVKDITKDDK
jgi:hypothetical protein|tara:strand:+ start:3453 stop:3986 length:534 start_codon:yes stop_codon:yes gene_type:complete